MTAVNIQLLLVLRCRCISHALLLNSCWGVRSAGLLEPRDTLMDLNIGGALWLAARGRGRVRILRQSDAVPGVPGELCSQQTPVTQHPADLTPPAALNTPWAGDLTRDSHAHIVAGPAGASEPLLPPHPSQSGVRQAGSGPGSACPVGAVSGASKTARPGPEGADPEPLDGAMGCCGDEACFLELEESGVRRKMSAVPCRDNLQWGECTAGAGGLPQGRQEGCSAGVRVCSRSDGVRDSQLPEYWAGGREYVSAARTVLLGHGADEQCGGYGRHRSQFRTLVGPPLPLAGVSRRSSLGSAGVA
jgi:hypothetical protein